MRARLLNGDKEATLQPLITLEEEEEEEEEKEKEKEMDEKEKEREKDKEKEEDEEEKEKEEKEDAHHYPREEAYHGWYNWTWKSPARPRKATDGNQNDDQDDLD